MLCDQVLFLVSRVSGRKLSIYGLGGGRSVAGELPACPLDGLASESLDRLIRHRDKEPATFFQLDRKRRRLDFNQSLPPADLQLGARQQACFSPQFLGNY